MAACCTLRLSSSPTYGASISVASSSALKSGWCLRLWCRLIVFHPGQVTVFPAPSGSSWLLPALNGPLGLWWLYLPHSARLPQPSSPTSSPSSPNSLAWLSFLLIPTGPSFLSPLSLSWSLSSLQPPDAARFQKNQQREAQQFRFQSTRLMIKKAASPPTPSGRRPPARTLVSILGAGLRFTGDPCYHWTPKKEVSTSWYRGWLGGWGGVRSTWLALRETNLPFDPGMAALSGGFRPPSKSLSCRGKSPLCRSFPFPAWRARKSLLVPFQSSLSPHLRKVSPLCPGRQRLHSTPSPPLTTPHTRNSELLLSASPSCTLHKGNQNKQLPFSSQANVLSVCPLYCDPASER